MTANTSALKENLDATREAGMRTAEAAADAAKEAGRVVAEGISDGAGAAKAATADAARQARDAASRQLHGARDALSDTAERVAETLRNAAEQAGSGPLQSGVLGALSGGVTNVVKGLRDRSLGEVATEVRDMARRNPALFALGAGLAGFALARFLRSTEGGHRFQSAHRAVTDDWTGSDRFRADRENRVERENSGPRI